MISSKSLVTDYMANILLHTEIFKIFVEHELVVNRMESVDSHA